ncbi:MAG: response regulator [Chitinophagaceae bacterium]|nr:response regulator [Chitinophagaceae bacterium]
MNDSRKLDELEKTISALQIENERLRSMFAGNRGGDSVSVPAQLKPVFDLAQETVNAYFRDLRMDASKGIIEINDQRYVLVRASGLSKGFLDTICNLYADRGKQEALTIGKNFLFDIAHVIGMNDAKNFHHTMHLTDPIAKLSAGPVHFAYSGWAFVNILPESNPTADDDYYLIYEHPYSFEADSWQRAGELASTTVCIMNAGYSSGWCEASFGFPLTAVEVSCIGRGDDCCRFIMSPPHRIQEHLDQFHIQTSKKYQPQNEYEIPTFFERKKVEEEMKRSQKIAEESARSKSDFVANMSHELRTPLGAIVGFTELLKKTTLDAEQQDYLQAISSAGGSLLSIINDVLDLSKIDAGKFLIEKVPFSLDGLMHSIEIVFRGRTREKGIQFFNVISDNIPANVIGDPMRLTQVLMNIVGNAIKFTDKGEVRIACEIETQTDSDVTIQFSVTDTGIGIPADLLPTIFDRFTQASTDITRKYGGTGLGLAITKQLIEMQGGSISIGNRTAGGTICKFSIPYSTVPIGVHDKANGAATVSEWKTQNRILVVEDNLLNQKLARVLLTNLGFEINIAENGAVAMELLSRENFDLILMDLQMPVLDGYNATKAIRNELNISTPIIATTAHALAGEKEKCLAAGMNDYMSKPFTEASLIRMLNVWLTSPQQEGKTSIASPSTIIDLSFLEKQTRNNKELIKEMAEVFVADNPLHIEELSNSIINEQWERIFKSAHLLRNTIGFFGLERYIGNGLLLIEQLAHARQNLDEIRNQFPAIKSVCAQAVKELTYLATKTSDN